MISSVAENILAYIYGIKSIQDVDYENLIKGGDKNEHNKIFGINELNENSYINSLDIALNELIDSDYIYDALGRKNPEKSNFKLRLTATGKEKGYELYKKKRKEEMSFLARTGEELKIGGQKITNFYLQNGILGFLKLILSTSFLLITLIFKEEFIKLFKFVYQLIQN